MERRTRRTIAAFTVLGAVLLAIPACSRDKGPDPAAVSSTTTAPPTTATTARPITPEEEVEAAYLDIMERYFRRLGLHAYDPEEPAGFHVGESLSQVKREIARYRELGQEVRFGPDGAPVPVVSHILVNGSTATLTSCIVDDTQLVLAKSGDVLNDAIATKTFDVTMKLAADHWLLSGQVLKLRTGEQGDCGG